MIFNSVTFLVFLILSVTIYWCLSVRTRPLFLFLASLVFYGFWRWEFIPVMMISTVVDYIVSLELGKPDYSQRRRRNLLLVSIVINLSLLFIFKYLLFFSDNVVSIANLFGIHLHMPVWNIVLPLGISFYTFQTMSYTIDVYRGHYRPIRDFSLYAAFVTFFPQLVAGPVLRASEVTDQLIAPKRLKLDMLTTGFKRILYGLFLKVVLADNIAPLVDSGFSIEAEALGGLDVWTLAFLFGLQIYFDFAGYSHVAIGCANMMGVRFPENFNFPYAAKSFKEFWKRWHISLSSWIRDYLYLPLAGVQVSDKQSNSEGGLAPVIPKVETRRSRTLSLFLTWGIMGLWHGANWTFVLWGLFHASMIHLERQLQRLWRRLGVHWNSRIAWAVTLGVAMLGWIPFRAQSLADALTMFGKVLNPFTYTYLSMRENIYLITALLSGFVIIAYELDRLSLRRDWEASRLFIPLNTIRIASMIVLVYIFFRPISQFIYFQF